MIARLSVARDRSGHNWLVRLFQLIIVLAALASPSTAAAADYFARRFDVVASVAESGDLHVRERIVFDFQSGTFKQVWREIPTARTDGIDIVEALMDGVRFTPGDGPGHIAVSGDNQIRVEWRFQPIGVSAHTFELHYIARGVVYRDGDRDVLRWRLLPTEHRYPIDQAVATIVTPAGTIEPPHLESRRVKSSTIGPHRDGLQVVASGVDRNGWVLADLRFAAGTIVTAMPEWQQRHQHAMALAPRWRLAGAGVFAAGLLLLLSLRQGYSAPSMEFGVLSATSPPEPLPAALAAVLAAKGRGSSYSAIATLLDLADRGVLRIAELPRTLGVRTYEISQVPGSHQLDTHEAEAIQIAFGGRGDPVTFSRARGRLARAGRRFSAAVNADLAARGFIDPDRKRARDRLGLASTVALITGAMGSVAAAPFIPRFDAWPFLVPLGLVAAGLVGVVIAASMTPLSDEGLVNTGRWRGFKRHLKMIAENKDDPAPASLDARWIVYGIALGLAYQFSRFLKRHRGLAPDWFRAPANDDGAAFAAFIGSHAVSSGAASGGGGGAAAGGGGSGAG